MGEEKGGGGQKEFRPPSPSSPPARDCVVKGKKSEKCHAELVSASNKIKYLRDPEINSG